MAPARKDAETAPDETVTPAAETAATYTAYVRMERRVTVDAETNQKVEPGDVIPVPLAEARKLVQRALASWSDPRPDLK